MNQTPTKLEVLKESLNLIYKALNKSNGSFTIDESHIIHLAVNNFKAHLEELEKAGPISDCKLHDITEESEKVLIV